MISFKDLIINVVYLKLWFAVKMTANMITSHIGKGLQKVLILKVCKVIKKVLDLLVTLYNAIKSLDLVELNRPNHHGDIWTKPEKKQN